MDEHIRREWIAAFAHELRSPVSAILGYAELVHDGALGDVDLRAADAVERIAAAAGQLIALLDGVDAAMDDAAGTGPVRLRAGMAQGMHAADLIGKVVAELRLDAEARGVTIVVEDTAVMLHTVALDAERALALALGAAVKGSPNATLRVSVSDGDVPVIVIAGCSLSPDRDEPTRMDATQRMSSAALRLSLARGSAHRAGGEVLLELGDTGGRVLLSLPRPADEAPKAPG